ncbi:MAG: hypothetical protein PVI60_08665, partial [Desulfobacteraceae bacterium]
HWPETQRHLKALIVAVVTRHMELSLKAPKSTITRVPTLTRIDAILTKFSQKENQHTPCI